MQTNFNVKASMLAAILSPAKAVKFLQEDDATKAGTLELLEKVGDVQSMLNKDTCTQDVLVAFTVLNEGQFVRFVDMNKPTAQRNKLSGANILENMVTLCRKTKLTDEAAAFLADNTPQPTDDATA